MKASKIEREVPDETALERHVLAGVEGDPAVREALARLAASNIEPSAFQKKLRLLRRPAVEAFRLGGGARLVEAEVSRLTYQRAEVTSNLARTVDPVRRVALQEQADSLKRDLDSKTAVLATVGAALPDAAAELATINREVDEAEVMIRKYTSAGLPPPVDLQERVIGFREKYLEVEAREKDRRSAFDEASAQASKLTQEALHALGTTLTELARSQFNRVVALLQKDFRRLEIFPGESDVRIARQYAEFQVVCALAERLGRGARLIEDVCWRELPERESAALRRVLRLGRIERLRRRRTTADVSDALADESRLGAA